MIHTTAAGTTYLTGPVVRVIASTRFEYDASWQMGAFIEGLDIDPSDYTADLAQGVDSPLEALPKLAGQLCYLSFEPGRFTRTADTPRYLENIMRQRHGSVLEHASVTMLFEGVDRTVTHELVRHRAGMAYSQVSQRYVSGRALRFVERIEFQRAADLHQAFEERIDAAVAQYEQATKRLLTLQREGYAGLAGDSATDRRKHVQQVARAVLPNDTEAPILVTGNLRAWRHVLEMRTSPHADTAIRRPFVAAWRQLVRMAPAVFRDFELSAGDDGVECLVPKYSGV